MEIVYLPKAEQDLEFWIRTNNKSVLRKISELTRAITENHFSGLGKPEPLRHKLTGKWSRRITEEHRFVYAIVDGILLVYSLKNHY